MSEENVELVRETFRLFEVRDFAAFEALWHSDCRLSGPEGWPEPGPFAGRDAAIGQFRRLSDDFDAQSFSLDIVAAEGDWVVVEFQWKVRGAGSGVETQFDLAGAIRVRDGLQREGHFRWNRADALEVAGLRDSGAGTTAPESA